MSKILIIDDDIYINDMLEKVLVREGYEVFHAYSGTEALLFLEKCKPDLILLDLMLPGLSGEKVLNQILDIPVIVLSAKVAVKDKVALLLNGAADYMTKPFELDELLARIVVQLRKEKKTDCPKELIYKELESVCRKCTELKVTDTAALVGVLDQMGLQYEIQSHTQAVVYGEIPISDLMLSPVKKKCCVLSIREHDESLESYYINLVGGGKHE